MNCRTASCSGGASCSSCREAVQALKDFARSSEQSGKQWFSEASKIIKQPDHCGSEDVDLDQKTWRDFLLKFKSWLFFADSKFDSELKFVEEHPKLTSELSKLNGEEQSRALQLYSIFAGVLRDKPLRLLRQQEDRNGLALKSIVGCFSSFNRLANPECSHYYLHICKRQPLLKRRHCLNKFWGWNGFVPNIRSVLGRKTIWHYQFCGKMLSHTYQAACAVADVRYNYV